MKTLRTIFTYLLPTILVGTMASCKDTKNTNEEETLKRTAEITTVIKNIEDPECKTSDEFINNVLTDREKQRCEDILNKLTLNEINEMCKTIIHREGYVNRKLFLKEYDQSYARIYRYLEGPIEKDTLVDSNN